MIIDICIASVPNENKQKYQKLVAKTSEMFKKLGAVKVIECWGRDVPQGKITSMPLAVKQKENETVVATIMFWDSEKLKDEAKNKMMNDQEFKKIFENIPFDAKNLIYGSFSKIIEV